MAVKQYNRAPMGTFRILSADDVRAIFAGYGCGEYRAHDPIAAGTINTNVAVRTTAGRFFLRVNEGKSRDDVEREAAIVLHVASRGVPTPRPLLTADGRPYASFDGAFVSLFPWVEGSVLSRSAVQPQHARQVGDALALLHQAGADLTDRRPGRYEPDEIRRRFVSIAARASGDPALEAAVAVLGPELDRLERERAAELPLGLIHGDLFIDNVLFDKTGRLGALLDFEQASWGRLAYDLAVCLLAFAYGQDDFRPDVTRALVEGYTRARPLSPVEREGFGAELRFVACRFAITRITDVYLRREAGAPGGKDFRRYVARLRSVQEHLRAADGLLEP